MVDEEDIEEARRVTTARINLTRHLSDLFGREGPDLVDEIEAFIDAKIALARRRS